MCWSEPVSWASFLVGTLFNVVLIKTIPDPSIYSIVFMWQWVLFMQFFDALMWRDQECGKVNRLATKGAYINTALQPVIPYFALIAVTQVSTKHKLMATIITLVYLIAAVHYLGNSKREIECTKFSKDCNHLQYTWEPFQSIPFVLYAVFIPLLLLLLGATNMAWFQISYIIVTYLLSYFIYPCALGSMWCWFAAFAPVFTYMYYKYTHKIV